MAPTSEGPAAVSGELERVAAGIGEPSDFDLLKILTTTILLEYDTGNY
jgi:hypothetical protein